MAREEKEIIASMLKKINDHKDARTKKALEGLNEDKDVLVKDTFVTKSKVLMEECVASVKRLNEEANKLAITSSTPQFGDIKNSQEEQIKKTVGENVVFDGDSLVYYGDKDDLVLNGKMPSLGLIFQFRYGEPSGDGIFIWADSTQLTDANLRAVGKLRDAFLNWKDSITNDGELLKKLNDALHRE